RLAQLRLGQHAVNGFLHQTRRPLLSDRARAFLAQSALVTTVLPVDLLVFLPAGEPDLRGIDDHDVIAGVEERRVPPFVLALPEPGGDRRDAAEHLALGVDHVPLLVGERRVRAGHESRRHAWFFPLLYSISRCLGDTPPGRALGRAGPGNGKPKSYVPFWAL